MAITKEQWEKIETVLSGHFASAVFTYKGFELTVAREPISESQTALIVYIDGQYAMAWGYSNLKHEVSAPDIVSEVWRARTKSLYSAKRVKELEKGLGKRACNKMGIYDKIHFHVPDFSKASVLVRQYKKLDGIELLEPEVLL
ncbi:hypothetical protein IHC87_06695 [Photobacterium damselae subsp. damselae]|uniref:hypothetical protein n=1 Tax=Photobacterium damselae TaxID=38293 RepID=UPI001F33A29B|nr:hypothetical protein [Photobacterium damselae]UJZ95027.1 hypothetical protein IHC87_06695 [Photobacterium damselae subsp. damselae]UJZ99008.1 hypothetical protein IHC88_06685 [Photobacterium damselae subsp. damselae]